jgi:hypothetical protein
MQNKNWVLLKKLPSEQKLAILNLKKSYNNSKLVIPNPGKLAQKSN